MEVIRKYGAALAFVALAAFAIYTAWYVHAEGWTLAYGDAEAHLNIARRLTDSRTPGYSQIGTVWLPVPHLLIAPFAAIDALWFSGLAGVIPALACFLLASVLLYLSARNVFGSRLAGLLAASVFALNPNMLYMAATPMTEPAMAAALTGILYTALRYRASPSIRALLLLAAGANLACLTRYEGWFLLPFLAMLVWWTGGVRQALWFCAVAAIAPVYWLIHNQLLYEDALAFYRGPYSAQAILAHQMAGGMPQPAMGDLWQSLRYYAYAVRDVLGAPVLIAAAVGTGCSIVRRQWLPLALLALPGMFYVLSIRSGGTPVFVPELAPYTEYNVRYALALLPFSGMAVAGIWRPALLPGAAALLCSSLLLAVPGQDCLSEALIQASAQPRRQMGEIAAALAAGYSPGDGIVFRFGSLTQIFRQAHIPLREGLYQDNLPQWEDAHANPGVFQQEKWALAEVDDEVDRSIHRLAGAYTVVLTIPTKGKPGLSLYRRNHK